MTVINPGGGGAAVAQGTLAGRPAPSANGLYYATDSNQFFVGNAAGNAWQNVVGLLVGTAATRPAAAATNANMAYYATDTGEVTFSNGAAWNSLTQTTAVGGFTSPVFKVGTGGLLWQVAGGGTNIAALNGGVQIHSAGSGLQVAEGANAKQGIATLAAGTVVVNTTAVTANSRIFLTPQETGALTGILRVSARTAGTSFTILSSVNTDTAVVAWEIFEPG